MTTVFETINGRQTLLELNVESLKFQLFLLASFVINALSILMAYPFMGTICMGNNSVFSETNVASSDSNRMARQTEMNQWQLRAPINFEFLPRANYFHINWTKIWNSTDVMHVVSLFCLLSHRLLGKSFFILPPFVNSPENLLRRKLLFEGYMAAA